MPKVNFFDHLRELCAADELREAAEKLKDFAQERKDKGLLNDAILLLGGISSLERQISQELIDASDAKVEKAQKRNGLLYHIERAEKKYGPVMVEVQAADIKEKTINSPKTSGAKQKILFLVASPSDFDKLRWKDEFTEISKGLQNKTHPFELFQERAITIDTLQEKIEHYQPSIVHFSGHGQGKNNEHEYGGIFVEDEDSLAVLVPGKALSGFFELTKEDFKTDVIVLNSCYTIDLAEELSKHIPFVIGMKSKVLDKAAIEFAKSFYRNLADKPAEVERAFKRAKVSIAMHNIPQADEPVLHMQTP
jgi:CHAT domain-containing protein